MEITKVVIVGLAKTRTTKIQIKQDSKRGGGRDVIAKGPGESDIAQPRTNRMRTGKRAPEAVHSAKTGHHRLTLQRQPNR